MVSCGAASESSPRRQPWEADVAEKEPRSGERITHPASCLSPLPGLRIDHVSTHGWRRGLLSDATPWLKASVIEVWAQKT